MFLLVFFSFSVKVCGPLLNLHPVQNKY